MAVSQEAAGQRSPGERRDVPTVSGDWRLLGWVWLIWLLQVGVAWGMRQVVTEVSVDF